ncbi:spermidine/putrescine ABC transporter substrate-binding protein [Microcoleus sp. FACHB-1515]|nr:spermidine/putrescine ABC transporter substrate-binding protein [Microcoleus sp. FACHB-1515]
MNFRTARSSARRVALTRRRFLQASAAAVSGAMLSNCARGISDPNAAQSSPTGEAADGSTLHVYSWSTYIDDQVIDEFTKATGIQVVADIYDSNETMLAKLQAGGGKAYSIIYPSDYMVQQMVELDLLNELDKSRIEGVENNLLDKWQNPVYDPNNTHSLPFAWGTTGLVYNSTKLTEAPTDWDYLWDNKDTLNQRLTLLNDVREVMGAVLKSLGHSYNSTDSAQIRAAYDKLMELKPAIASFTSDGWRDQLVTGDLILSMGYSVDAIDVMTANPDVKYVIPASGSSLWTDTMVIPKGAPNPEAAYAWMNFMYSPESAARVVNQLKIATPIRAAFDKIDADLRNNPSLFPPEELLAKCEGIAPVPPEVSETLDKYWTQLTSA